MIDLGKIQKENLDWAIDNFGKRQSHLIALGVNEELGELIKTHVGQITILKNNKCYDIEDILLKLMEANGRLSHSELKTIQSIRGSREQLAEQAKDAVGDILIYLLDYCNARGWQMEDILRDTWNQVKDRNWKKNNLTGNNNANNYLDKCTQENGYS